MSTVYKLNEKILEELFGILNKDLEMVIIDEALKSNNENIQY